MAVDESVVGCRRDFFFLWKPANHFPFNQLLSVFHILVKNLIRMPPRTKRARTTATTAATRAATAASRAAAAAAAAVVADAGLAPKRVRNVALATLANTHCLCGRKSAHGTAVCRQLLRDARGAGADEDCKDESSSSQQDSDMVACVAQTLIEFARMDGGLDNVRKLEDARLATLVAPFVRGRAHCVAPGRWYCVSPPPHSRWSSADDDGAQIMCLFNDRVLPAVTRLRQHVCGASVSVLSGTTPCDDVAGTRAMATETVASETTSTTSTALTSGLAANGLAANGLAANGLAVNGLAVNGLAVNGLAANGLAANGLAAYHRTLAEQLLRDIESTLRKHDARRRIVREVALLAGIYDPEFEQRLDANTSLLGFENCVFDLATGGPREARATDYLSRSTRLHFPVDASITTIAERPTVQRILWRLRAAMPRADEFQYLLHVLAACFVGERSDLLHVWLGGGANMKTQCVRLIKAMLGSDYFAEIEPELLTRARPSTACAAPDILMLAHKRCVCLSEICAREQLRTALMKRLTGDETLVARDLYSRRMVAVQPIAVWLLLSNHDVDIAHTLDERHAIARRVRRLHFRVRFVNQQPHEGEQKVIDGVSGDANVGAIDGDGDGAIDGTTQGATDGASRKCAVSSASKCTAASAVSTSAALVDDGCCERLVRRAVPKALLDREFADGAADFAAYLLLVVLPQYRELQRRTGCGLPSVATVDAGTRAYLEQFDSVLEWFRAVVDSGMLRRVAETPPVSASTSPVDLWREFRTWLAAKNSGVSGDDDDRGVGSGSNGRNSGRGGTEGESGFRPCPRRQAFQQRVDELLGEVAVSCGARRYRYLHWQYCKDNSDGV
jgi:hypothetical protein